MDGLKSYKLITGQNRIFKWWEWTKQPRLFYKNGGASFQMVMMPKLLLKNKRFRFLSILIEYKGYENKLVKLDIMDTSRK